MRERGGGVLTGHMARALADIRENLKAVQVVLEVVDARIPWTSRNPHLNRVLGGKARILVLNKADLVDEDGLRRWVACLRGQGLAAVPADAVTGRGVERVLAEARAAGGRPAVEQSLRAMIVGIPNVGKSSLLNRLAGGARARTGARPGVTRGKQWVRAGDLHLLDLPGVLPPYLRNRQAVAKLAIIAAVGPESFPAEVAALVLIDLLRERAPRQLELFYGLESESGEAAAVLEAVGRRRGCLAAGGRVDAGRAAGVVLKDFRAGKLGRLTLEDPPCAAPNRS